VHSYESVRNNLEKLMEDELKQETKQETRDELLLRMKQKGENMGDIFMI